MAKHNYLIEGLSGTGKSSVCSELIKLGYTAIDADDAFASITKPSIISLNGKKIPERWDWDPKKLKPLLLNKTEDTLFICGGASNENDFIPLFEVVITLIIDNETMRNRLTTRIANNYGKRHEEITQQQEWNKSAAIYAQQRGIDIIDATQPLSRVVDEVLNLTINRISAK